VTSSSSYMKLCKDQYPLHKSPITISILCNMNPFHILTSRILISWVIDLCDQLRPIISLKSCVECVLLKWHMSFAFSVSSLWLQHETFRKQILLPSSGKSIKPLVHYMKVISAFRQNSSSSQGAGNVEKRSGSLFNTLPRTWPDERSRVSFRNLHFNQIQNMENFIYVPV
jgi:hypothetical protein